MWCGEESVKCGVERIQCTLHSIPPDVYADAHCIGTSLYNAFHAVVGLI